MLKSVSLQRNSVAKASQIAWRCLKQFKAGTAELSTQAFQKENVSGSLERTFDDVDYWHEVNKRNYVLGKGVGRGIKGFGFNIPSKTETGLFENPYLTSPEGLRKFSRRSLTHAQGLLDDMRNDKSFKGLTAYVMRLDQLSDTLCRVIDLCEFIRSSHPDSSFIEAAQACHEEMFEFMNILNTDVELCDTLRQVLTDPEIKGKLSNEEITVGKILLEDFEKSGIYMNPEVRDQFIALSQEISLVGQEFINNTDYVRSNYIKIKCEEVDNSGINKLLISQLPKDVRGKYYKIATHGYIAYSILRSCPDEEIRMNLWTAMHRCSDKQINRLDQLLRLRAILAKLMGKESFAQYQLEGKMAQTPQQVRDFIGTLVNYMRPKTIEELKFIYELKSKQEKREIQPSPSEQDIASMVRPWDREYYTSMYSIQQRRDAIDDEQISSYFTLGNVIQGLSDLFESIYGIRLEPVVPKTGETFSPEVRRLNVVCEQEGVIGVVYCDLFERAGKTSNPSHFTVCCSRQIYPKETEFSTIQTGFNSEGLMFQLPVIALVCNFSSSTDSEGKSICLLQLNEVETLFHEMGHAMHSMLGRTRLQNISGTRCATDFVELPSILMEHFARDVRVLERIGKHHRTGAPISEKLLLNYLEETKFMQHCETFSQAKMAMLDQDLHGEKVIKDFDHFDVTAAYQQLERDMKVLVDDKSNWCGKFGHLFGYGATYYSYLFDRAIASKVWDSLFSSDPYSRVNGEKFKECVLKWGGSRNPWRCIADVLNKPELSEGGTEAMRYIGQSEDL